jgi:rod shape-determining protein MreD
MEAVRPTKQILLIILSFLVGMILEIVPLPRWAIWIRPEWVFVILLFWVLSQPHYVGICVAFSVGILMDLLTGTVLGQHAFVFSLIVYVVITFHPQLKSFPLGQQFGIIFTLTLLQLALQCWILGMIDRLPLGWGYWLPALSSAVIWPWFYFLLKERHEIIRNIR